MRHYLPVLSVLVGWLLLAPSIWCAEARRATALRTTERIRVDGVLDEAVWQNSPPIGELIQADPFPGKPATERTEVRVAYNDDALYIAIRCFDSAPETIFTSTMARDGSVFSDDAAIVAVDTFHDHRNGYVFATNAAGALNDARVTDGRNDSSWDGIWWVKTKVDEQGWTAEYEIPFKTLSFDPGITTWGFNVQRRLAKRNEEDRWEAATLEGAVFDVSRAGDLEGLEGLSQGIGLDIKPYGLLGVNRSIDRQDRVQGLSQAGADIFYRITPSLLSSTTINTDFAETEVDTRQVNLTRFSLFFPEKRDFFVEDAGVFQFGLSNSSRTMIPFHSRRIGLVGGTTVPILAGEKLTGTAGRLKMGLLDVRTRDSDVAPAQNFAVGRVKYGFWHQSYVGGIFTNGEPTGKTDNSTLGTDIVLATSNFLGRRKTFDVSAYGVKTNTPGITSRDFAYGAQVRYPNDFLNLSYSWQEIGANFNPQLGFVPRSGVRISTLSSSLGPRPNVWNIRKVSFSFDITNYFNRNYNAVETRTYTITPLGLDFHSGHSLSYSLTHNFERLFEPFRIHTGIEIPVGGYSFLQHNFSFQGPDNKPLSYGASYVKGEFYSGHSDELSGSLSWRKSAQLTASVEFSRYWVRLKEGNFNTFLALFRFNYCFSPTMTLTNFLQYDTDSRNIGLQSRLMWIMRPGNELYFVFNHEWQENALDRFEALRSDVRAKINYTFRF